jgi:uncharacterized protein
MKWSKYNFLFTSEKYGNLLYNSLTNTFAELDNGTYNELLKIKDNPNTYDLSSNPGLYLQLMQTKILFEDNEEEDIWNIMKLRRNQSNYSNQSLGLTIAPTRECNFNCSYCYEEFRKPIYMSDETEDKIIEFIKRFGKLARIHITWYGGEPLLDFNRIISLTAKIKNLEIPLSAGIVTNGYLLDENVIDKLEDLKINHMQITLDGSEATHNKRRPHIHSGDSFSKIVQNIERLIEKWDYKLSLRVNIDKTNIDEYAKVYELFSAKFKGKKAKVYPGIVADDHQHPDLRCSINRKEEVEFMVRQYKEYGIKDLDFYPRNEYSGCVATGSNGFVIGPEGELYKCWNDLGLENRVVGSIYPYKEWNLKLLSRYMVGVDPMSDEKCRECFYIPICGGGCPNQRLKKKYEGKEDLDYCVKFKGNLPELLEIHYEKKMNK